MSVVLVFCVVFAAVYFLVHWYKIFLCGIRLPGPWSVPCLGNVQFITKLKPEKLLDVIHTCRETYRHSFRLWLGPQLWVFLHSPQETRDALNDATLKKADSFQMLNIFIGNGLLISEGKEWELHRKALGPAFHPNILNGFTHTIIQHVNILVDRLRDLNSQPIEVSDYLFACIMDTIIDTLMGKNLETQKNQNHPYTHAFHRTSELLFERMVNPLLFPDFIYNNTQRYKDLVKYINVIHNLMDSVILERQKFLEQEENQTILATQKQRCLLDTLLTATIEGNPLSLKEIRDEVNTFVFAGVDTTTAAMCFVLYCLGKYPQEQQKLLEEIQSIRRESDEGFPNTSDLNKLEYLDMFIKECLRLYTIVPMTGRQTTKTTKIGGRLYPPGVTLWINMYGLCHDSQLYEEPFIFKPSRFTRMEYQRLPKFSYIPFSGGPHVCIGRKYSLLIMKIMCVRLLENFEVTLKDPNEKLILMSQMTLKSKNGINVIFRER
ncbi:probable cytochrome P450 311a1 [Musca vetustissima]|uniref:probable cytochrome P450 311a1 n=1 Tax=Musca vetustissima TaxID=27455 RepID=UPI002AB5ED67|nr:probable cytochrome P450 311a1 [Musca vetustissima]